VGDGVTTTLRKVRELNPGDLVDLAADPLYAAWAAEEEATPGGYVFALEFEYAAVESLVVESPTCTAVYFENFPGFGYDPDHELPVHVDWVVE
jgi:hypothetical protein